MVSGLAFPPVIHLPADEVGDDAPIEIFDEVRVQALFFRPLPAPGEHGLLTFGGADAVLVGLEAGRGGDVPGAAAEEAQELAVQAVYALADVFDALAVFGRFQETSPRT